uniref:Uncharacterized protein n=1 Tax=Chromera velia CCMP2878 TaxID=1169474 RepID=A0A0G4I3B0_9ALVE|eukprot:Cvel_10619.t1-p1 / transcript=Cvel_10619.t1 / gene=Cvel_10619 / organism=Chromera_velia_CCMP2878 / gene_product=hypothetical protein / transcript_product=hypothetical protein / location=Cvel_scaffold644:67172-73478(+) / protein_length=183 / sequence_SO=supercontig / SO=protein_coding / is_pseudo=false
MDKCGIGKPDGNVTYSFIFKTVFLFSLVNLSPHCSAVRPTNSQALVGGAPNFLQTLMQAMPTHDKCCKQDDGNMYCKLTKSGDTVACPKGFTKQENSTKGSGRQRKGQRQWTNSGASGLLRTPKKRTVPAGFVARFKGRIQHWRTQKVSVLLKQLGGQNGASIPDGVSHHSSHTSAKIGFTPQ